MSKLELTGISFALSVIAAICAESGFWYMCGVFAAFAVFALVATCLDYLNRH